MEPFRVPALVKIAHFPKVHTAFSKSSHSFDVAGFAFSRWAESSGNVVVPPIANALRLIQKKFPVAQRSFGILIDGNNDRLDVLVAPAFARRQLPNFRKRFDEGRIVSVVVKPLQRIAHGSYKNRP
jgi:hypothetical protein